VEDVRGVVILKEVWEPAHLLEGRWVGIIPLRRRRRRNGLTRPGEAQGLRIDIKL